MRRLISRLALSSILMAATTVTASGATLGTEPTHAWFRVEAGPIKVMGLVEELGDDAYVKGAVAGLRPGQRTRLIGSTRPCSKPHVASASAFVLKLPWLLGGDPDRPIVMVDASSPSRAVFSRLRSVRLYTRHSGGVQKACARALPFAASDTAATSPRSLAVATFDGRIAGLAAFGFDADASSLSAILTGLPPGSASRIIATDDACGKPVTSADVVARRRVVADSRGVVAAIDIPVQASLGRENSIECLYVMRGSQGFTSRTARPTSSFSEIVFT